MNFLGQVNQFRGRLERGRVWIGRYEGQAPNTDASDGGSYNARATGSDSQSEPKATATIYIRPHDFEISKGPQQGRLSASDT